jgi:hypothetical protein
MIKKSLSSPERFLIKDESTGEIFRGCAQEWYRTFWQKRAGCGPTTAANIILYMSLREKNYGLNLDLSIKSNCILLMEELWKYVTPTLKGVNTTKIFYSGIALFAEKTGMKAEFHSIEVPRDKSKRPGFTEVLDFIINSMDRNSPTAFLNLCNGEEECLDKWHWVTIISVEYDEVKTSAFAEILDEGTVKKVDLSLWYKTTSLGGGFVYLDVING